MAQGFRLVLERFKGLHRFISPYAFQPEWLLHAVGFVVNDDGYLETEPRWGEVPITGDLANLSSYRVLAVGCYPEPPRTADAVGDNAGYYYIAVISPHPSQQAQNRRIYVLKTPRATAQGSTNWRMCLPDGSPSSGRLPYEGVGGNAHFSTFAGTVYLCLGDGDAPANGSSSELWVDRDLVSQHPTFGSNFRRLTVRESWGGSVVWSPRFTVAWGDRLFAAQTERIAGATGPMPSRVYFADPGLGYDATHWKTENYFDIETWSGTGLHGAIVSPSVLYFLKGVNVYGLYGMRPDDWVLRRIINELGMVFSPNHSGVYDPFSQIVYAVDPNTNILYGFRGGQVFNFAAHWRQLQFVGHSNEHLHTAGRHKQYLYCAPPPAIWPGAGTPRWQMEDPDGNLEPLDSALGQIWNLRNRAVTHSLYFRNADGSPIHWRASTQDPNLGRLIIAGDKVSPTDPHRIYYIDSNMATGWGHQRLSSTAGRTAFVATRFLDFGSPGFKRITSLWVAASVIQEISGISEGQMPKFRVFCRALTHRGADAGMGRNLPWVPCPLADQRLDPEDPLTYDIPADGMLHRVAIPSGDPEDAVPAYSVPSGRVCMYFAVRLEYSGSSNDLGIRIERIVIEGEHLADERAV